MWNQKEHTAPALCLLRAKIEAYKKDIHGTWSSMKKFVTHCSDVTPYLTLEQHILTRSIYKHNLAMRKEKGLGYLKQIRKCLNNLVTIAPHEIVVNLFDVWPSPDDARIADGCVYVPSRQNVQFALFRLQGAAKLLERILIQAMLSYSEALQQIHSGMIIHSMIVFASISSRIWFLCHSLLTQVISVYPTIHMAMLELEGRDLAGSNTLPINLEEFLETSMANLEVYSEEFKRNKSAVDNLLEKYGITVQDNTMDSEGEESSVAFEDIRSPGHLNRTRINQLNDLEDVGSPVMSTVSSKVKTKKFKKEKIKAHHLFTSNINDSFEDIGSPIVREKHMGKSERKQHKAEKKCSDKSNEFLDCNQSVMDKSGSECTKKKDRNLNKQETVKKKKKDKSQKGGIILNQDKDIEGKKKSELNAHKSSPDYNKSIGKKKHNRYLSEIENIRKLSALRDFFQNLNPKIKAKNESQYKKCSKKLNRFSQDYKSATKEERKKMFKKSKIILRNFFKQPRKKS